MNEATHPPSLPSRRLGPLELDVSDERTVARVPGSADVVVDVPTAHATAQKETLDRLRQGLPVLVGGEERLVLRQPERSTCRRSRRRILVEGDPTLVAPGVFLRARWIGSMGLESDPSIGAERERRLVRPRPDLLNAPFLWGASLTIPVVDPSVAPDLLALWGAAEWHLIAAVHV